MELLLESNNPADYLRQTDVIDFNNLTIPDEFEKNTAPEIALVKRLYEFVRDNIAHSADISGTFVTCNASDVLEKGEGICYAKSHLLAALLRKNEFPRRRAARYRRGIIGIRRRSGRARIARGIRPGDEILVNKPCAISPVFFPPNRIVVLAHMARAKLRPEPCLATKILGAIYASFTCRNNSIPHWGGNGRGF